MATSATLASSVKGGVAAGEACPCPSADSTTTICARAPLPLLSIAPRTEVRERGVAGETQVFGNEFWAGSERQLRVWPGSVLLGPSKPCMFALVAAATAHPAWTASTAARKLVPAGSDFDAPPVLAPKAVPNYLGWLPRTPSERKPWAMADDNQTNAVKQRLSVLPSSEARDPWKRKIFLVLGSV